MEEIIQLNSGAKLSPHFTLGEMTTSNHKEVYNIPSHEAIANLKRLCGWLEVLRERYNERYGVGEEPIRINSGYRSPQLNRKIGGAPTSNHLTGCACDINDNDIPIDDYALYLIRSLSGFYNYLDSLDLQFDRLIEEFGMPSCYQDKTVKYANWDDESFLDEYRKVALVREQNAPVRSD